MSEAAAHRPGRAARIDDRAERARDAYWLADRRPPLPAEVAVLVAMAVASAAAASIVATGGVSSDPTGLALVLVANIVGLTLAGLLWLRARPWSPFGRILLALALLVALSGLVGSSSPRVYVAGVVFGWCASVLTTYAIVAFPGGRLDRAARAVVGLAVVPLVVLALPEALLSPTVVAASPIGRCAANCPANPLLVASMPSAANDLTMGLGIARAALAVAIVAYLGARFARASRPRRRIVLPVYAASLLFVTTSGLDALLADTLRDHVQQHDLIRIASLTMRIVFPFGFAAAIMLAQAYAGTALSAMARELGSGPSVAAVERLVQRVLDDPRARLAFWLPRAKRFTDRHGRPIALDPAQERRTWRSFGRGDDHVLAVEHDPALSDDPELVQAVGAATLLALENRRLQQDLLDSIAALRASQRRLVMAAAAERRKIERDLHDSTQQKLVAIRIQLELAIEQAAARTGLKRRLVALGDELDDALDELRAVAHGIYPPLLADEGLVPALRESARAAGIPVELRLGDIGTLPEELEAAVYYCCREALQNVAKHGGDGVTAVLSVRRDGRTLRFSVSDDGVGFVVRPRRLGHGLTNMTDRIAAFGGALAVRSAPGEGTTVDGRVSIPAKQREANGARG